tara:strand:- start:553 stop:915 length:363 start_codon:yes stop_codon:yes gene_type:complete
MKNIAVDKYLPGPYTFIFKKIKSNLSSLVSLDYDSVGVRIPNHNFPIKLVKQFKNPIITTSVNLHNSPPLFDINSIKNMFKDISIFQDDNILKKSNGSTILDCTLDPVNILRQGDGVFKI